MRKLLVHVIQLVPIHNVLFLLSSFLFETLCFLYANTLNKHTFSGYDESWIDTCIVYVVQFVQSCVEQVLEHKLMVNKVRVYFI